MLESAEKVKPVAAAMPDVAPNPAADPLMIALRSEPTTTTAAVSIANNDRHIPAGATFGNATTCYRCGARIEHGEPRYRVSVHTGSSSGKSLSGLSCGMDWHDPANARRLP
jgi:hypothetical protein